MPRKLSSPSKHGSRSEVLFARKVSPVNPRDFDHPPDRLGNPSRMSDGAVSRSIQRYGALAERKTGNEAYDRRTKMAKGNQWSAQEQLRSAGWSAPELTSLSKNYADASKYHFDKGSFDKADHYHALSRAAKQEATTAKRVATAAKNKADRAARVKVASDRVAAKQLAKSAKVSKSKSKKGDL